MKKRILAIASAAQTLMLLPFVASAQVGVGLGGANNSIVTIGNVLGTSVQGDLPTLVGKIINVFLGVLGIIFVVLVVYAGFLYLMDQGKEENVKKAKKLLTTSVIGLVIIVAAYAISNYVIDALVASVAP